MLGRFGLLAALVALCCAPLGNTALASGPTPVVAPLTPADSATLGLSTPVLDPSGHALDHFYESLRATARGEDKTRVAIFGASHVAGDIFTKVIRHRLQERFGDAGPGFVVPAYPWRDYNHRDVNITYNRKRWESFWVSRTRSRPDDDIYGLSGCTFESSDKEATCRISTARRSKFGRAVTRMEVFYWAQPRGGDFYVVLDGRKKKRIKTRSKEAGPRYAAFEVEDGSHSIEIRPRGNGKVTLFGVAMDREKPGVVVDTMGINGARASSQLSWNPRLFAEHLTRRDHDLVVLAYGTNATGDDDDPIGAYEKRLDLVTNRIRSLLPEASCLVVGPSDRPIKLSPPEGKKGAVMTFLSRPRQAQVIAAQKRVAARYGCGHWDMAAAMGGDLSMLQWTHSEPRFGARDYVHLTPKGYLRMGDLLWEAMMAGYEVESAGATAQ